MPLPNFIHAGQPKAGSTTLHFTLRQHPDICLPLHKEAHFFDNHFDEGETFYSDSVFQHYNRETIVGDITPGYWRDEYLRRIAASLPDARISICLRAPVARSYSHYCHEVRLLNEDRSFGRAMDEGRGYIEPSATGSRVRTLLELFPRERIKFLIFERDISVGSLPLTVAKMLDFLNIRFEELPIRRENTGFLPHLTFADRSRSVLDHRGESHDVRSGDVVIETLVDADRYALNVERCPAENRLSHLRRVSEDVTTLVAPDEIRDHYSRFFEEDVELVRELLQDPLPEWNISPDTSLRAPARIRSRFAGEVSNGRRTAPKARRALGSGADGLRGSDGRTDAQVSPGHASPDPSPTQVGTRAELVGSEQPVVPVLVFGPEMSGSSLVAAALAPGQASPFGAAAKLITSTIIRHVQDRQARSGGKLDAYLASFIHDLMDEVRSEGSPGAPVVLHEHDLANVARDLHRFWPHGIRLICVVRDPRELAAVLRERRRRNELPSDDVACVTKRAREQLTGILDALDDPDLERRLHVVRYEDLLSQDQRALSALRDYCELGKPGWAAFRSVISSQLEKPRPFPIYPEVLSVDEIGEVEGLFSEPMLRFDYPLTANSNHARRLQARVRSLAAELADGARVLDETCGELRAMRRSRDEVALKNQDVQEELVQERSALAGARSALAEARSELETEGVRRAARDAEQAAVHEDLEAARRRVVSAEDALTLAEGEIKALRMSASVLQGQTVEDLRHEIHALRLLVNERTLERDDAVARLQDLADEPDDEGRSRNEAKSEDAGPQDAEPTNAVQRNADAVQSDFDDMRSTVRRGPVST